MRAYVKIAVVAVALFCAACASHSGARADDDVVASVGASFLYHSELRSAMPVGLSAEDSVSYAEAYLSRWIVSQLKIDEAKSIFLPSEEIESMVEEYRRSLLERKFEQHILSSEPSTDISDADIAEYYNDHKSDFRVATEVVRGKVIAIPSDSPLRESLIELFDSSERERCEDCEQICLKNNLPYHGFDDWVPVSDFLSCLPLTRNARHEDILLSRELQLIQHENTHYYFRITAALKVGDMMPLKMAEENIRQILINSHRTEVVRNYEERLLKNALSLGQAKIMKTE